MRILYVDDEQLQLENFRRTTEGLEEIDSLQLFDNGKEALEWAKRHPVDVAFLDVEMPVMTGMDLARELKAFDPKIVIIFVTAYDSYALEAFKIRAAGYLLKPYGREDIAEELENARTLTGKDRKKRIHITTMPDLYVTIDGKNLFQGHSKQEELFALLVDRGKTGIMKGDALGCLSDGRLLKDSTYWSWFSRLKTLLEEAGAPDLIITTGNTKYLNLEEVDCDIYRMQEGEREAIAKYSGRYLERYAWAEERIAELDQIKKHFEKNT